MATASESFVQHTVEFDLLSISQTPRYYLRIGINYHGKEVQHIQLDGQGRLVGWNPSGNALGIGKNAKILLAGMTIFSRDADEQLKSDCKVGGGDIEPGRYVRMEFKVRGWLGKTKNLDGSQLEKDVDLLKDDKADLLVVCLSETAHLKWIGKGSVHHASRRTGTGRFSQLLVDPISISTWPDSRSFVFEGQQWASSTDRVVGGSDSTMPDALHYVTLLWRKP